MNRQMLTYFAIVTIVAGVFAASAFSASRVDARVVTASVVGDSAAYLAVYSNSASPHKDYVSQGADGKITVSFGSCACSTGTGVNPDAIYEWDDLIKITNQGTATVYIKVTTTATTGALYAAVETTSGNMTDSDYSTSTTPVSLAVGSTLYLGLKTDSTGLTSGQSVSGSFTIYATRTNAGTL